MKTYEYNLTYKTNGKTKSREGVMLGESSSSVARDCTAHLKDEVTELSIVVRRTR